MARHLVWLCNENFTTCIDPHAVTSEIDELTPSIPIELNAVIARQCLSRMSAPFLLMNHQKTPTRACPDALTSSKRLACLFLRFLRLGRLHLGLRTPVGINCQHIAIPFPPCPSIPPPPPPSQKSPSPLPIPLHSLSTLPPIAPPSSRTLTHLVEIKH
jgi:hypothetical protein